MEAPIAPRPSWIVRIPTPIWLIGLIIVATTTSDMIFPSTACILQAKLGVRNSPAFDVQAVCSGFVYGLATADHFMRGGQYGYALVVGTEAYSRILDWKDRSTCVLFGDGAGAVVLRQDRTPGIMSTHLHADGSYAETSSTVVILAKSDETLAPFRRLETNLELDPRGLRPWTDDFSDIIGPFRSKLSLRH